MSRVVAHCVSRHDLSALDFLFFPFAHLVLVMFRTFLIDSSLNAPFLSLSSRRCCMIIRDFYSILRRPDSPIF